MNNTVHSQGSVSGDAKLLRASHHSATMTVKIGFGSGVGTSTGLGSMDEKMCSLRACRIERARKLRRAG